MFGFVGQLNFERGPRHGATPSKDRRWGEGKDGEEWVKLSGEVKLLTGECVSDGVELAGHVVYAVFYAVSQQDVNGRDKDGVVGGLSSSWSPSCSTSVWRKRVDGLAG